MAVNLETMRIKVRKLTKALTDDRLSDDDIDTYIDTFMLYDMPNILQLDSLKKIFSFYTTPGVDTYDTTTIAPTNPLYNFKNKVISLESPVYISGLISRLFQSQMPFFAYYTYPSSDSTITTGDGVTANYNGTLTGFPFLQNEVFFTSVDANGASLVVKDIPQIDAVTGQRIDLGNLVVADNDTVIVGTFNYATGVYNFTFPFAPATGENVDSHTVSITTSIPTDVLFFDNAFTVRPVPDKVYKVQITATVRPTQLIEDTDVPELEQWWQYICYGASKKAFEDRGSTEGVRRILPEMENQKILCMRRTIESIAQQRPATVFDRSSRGFFFNGYGPGGW